MQLEHHFTVPAPVDVAWDTLLDIKKVAPCMPGASLDSVEDEQFTGHVKVKLGPVSMLYKGVGKFVEKDKAAHRVKIEASGKDSKGNGTAAATVTASLAEKDGKTEVTVLTDLNITGRPAQFGRGMINEVGNKLIGQFANSLAESMSGPEKSAQEPVAEKAGATAGGGGAATAGSSTTGPDSYTGLHEVPADDAIDLLDLVDEETVKKIVIGVGAFVGLVALFVIIRRAKRRH